MSCHAASDIFWSPAGPLGSRRLDRGSAGGYRGEPCPAARPPVFPCARRQCCDRDIDAAVYEYVGLTTAVV